MCNMKFWIISIFFLVQSGLLECKPFDSNDIAENEIDYQNTVNKKDDKKTIQSASTQSVKSTKVTANTETTTETSSTKPPPENILNLLLPILNRWKITPQTFFQDRLNALKQSLNNFGIVIPTNATTSKQFATTSGLLHLVGLNDPGFYTDRFEPAGFLGGNGWFANKGGILGGPGAILSTGSLLTDYPTPYKK